MLPLGEPANTVTLDEGGTPLHHAAMLGKQLGLNQFYLKDETRNPTGSFKDRGTSVGVSVARENGLPGIGCVSTGNMANSIAAYAAKAGMRALVFVPATTPHGKLVPMLAYGATVIVMGRPYAEIFETGLELGQELGFLWLHSDAHLRVEGQKTTAFEIWEQMGRAVPDVVVVPTSSGGNISAIWKGFKELEAIGLIGRLPRMVAVQAEGASPIARAFKTNQDTVKPFGDTRTEAHSISNPDPPSGRRVLRLLRESGGLAETVTDREMLESQAALARYEGILAEMASVSGIAVLKGLVKSGQIEENARVVSIVTGTGLKDMETVARGSPGPLRFDSWTECRKALKRIAGGTT
jgi:threonine synthase